VWWPVARQCENNPHDCWYHVVAVAGSATLTPEEVQAAVTASEGKRVRLTWIDNAVQLVDIAAVTARDSYTVGQTVCSQGTGGLGSMR
jgi:hypothetical protein